MDSTHIIERLIPGVNRRFGEGSAALRQHLLRYRFATAYVREGDRVLDAGCGSGYGAYILAQAGAQVVGVDRSEEAIAYARTTYRHDNITWIRSHLHDYQPPARSFDRIVCFELIEHVERPNALILSLFDMLKEAGVMICSVPVIPTRHFDCYHRHDFDAHSFAAIFVSSGFVILDRLVQEDTYLTLVVSKSRNPDLEPMPIDVLGDRSS